MFDDLLEYFGACVKRFYEDNCFRKSHDKVIRVIINFCGNQKIVCTRKTSEFKILNI